MVHYSSNYLNSELIVCYLNGKKLVTEWHLVSKLFTMVANRMVGIIQLATIWIPNKIKIGYSDKFVLRMFTIQIPTVYVKVYVKSHFSGYREGEGSNLPDVIYDWSPRLFYIRPSKSYPCFLIDGSRCWGKQFCLIDKSKQRARLAN